MRKATDLEIEIFKYLNGLRESGETNMFGAGDWIQHAFSVSPSESMKLLVSWMNNFNEEADYEYIKTEDDS